MSFPSCPGKFTTSPGGGQLPDTERAPRERNSTRHRSFPSLSRSARSDLVGGLAPQISRESPPRSFRPKAPHAHLVQTPGRPPRGTWALACQMPPTALAPAAPKSVKGQTQLDEQIRKSRTWRLRWGLGNRKGQGQAGPAVKAVASWLSDLLGFQTANEALWARTGAGREGGGGQIWDWKDQREQPPPPRGSNSAAEGEARGQRRAPAPGKGRPPIALSLIHI